MLNTFCADIVVLNTIKRAFSLLLLCGVLALTACSSQGREGAEMYNHIYKNGWMEMPPMQGERPFSDKTRAALL